MMAKGQDTPQAYDEARESLPKAYITVWGTNSELLSLHRVAQRYYVVTYLGIPVAVTETAHEIAWHWEHWKTKIPNWHQDVWHDIKDDVLREAQEEEEAGRVEPPPSSVVVAIPVLQSDWAQLFGDDLNGKGQRFWLHQNHVDALIEQLQRLRDTRKAARPPAYRRS